ncbi:WD40-repeat-containing domain protein [Sporodiniella umbellata]|nr:WD40-repeat-containing domain protein [Sporodiniella umbellata]
MHHRSFGREFRVPSRGMLPFFTSRSNYLYQFVFPDGEYCTPLSTDYAHRAHHGYLLAIGDEEGRISLLRTDKDNSTEDRDFHHTFYCHRHGISDVKFSLDDQQLLTASNDRLITLWDVESRQRVANLPGHEDYVKSINWHPSHPHLIISASKDGSFRIWDTRYRQKRNTEEDVLYYEPIQHTPDAHVFSMKKTANAYHHVIRSVTCALFSNLDDTKAITSGSADGTIKLWDIRAGRQTRVVESSVFENSHGQRRGITDLKMDQSGARLFSSCMDNSIYMHYLADLSRPAVRYRDPDFHLNTFDIKLTVSPNDEFLMAGSHEKDIFVWELDSPQQSVYQFKAHTRKVPTVAWHKSDIHQFASCSEDFTTRIWNFSIDAMQTPDTRIYHHV